MGGGGGGVMFKPCIPSTQGRGEENGAAVAVRWETGSGSPGDSWRSPLLGGLGGAGRGDGPSRVDPAVLVFGLLLGGLQDLGNKMAAG